MSHFATIERGNRAAPVSNQRKPSGNIERAAPIYPASRGGSTCRRIRRQSIRRPFDRGEHRTPRRHRTRQTRRAACQRFASSGKRPATPQPFRPMSAATVRPCAGSVRVGFRPPSVQPLPVRPAIAATVRPSPAPFSRIRRQSIENALASRPPLRSCPRPPWQPIRQH